jgi:hypothetical protein
LCDVPRVRRDRTAVHSWPTRAPASPCAARVRGLLVAGFVAEGPGPRLPPPWRGAPPVGDGRPSATRAERRKRFQDPVPGKPSPDACSGHMAGICWTPCWTNGSPWDPLPGTSSGTLGALYKSGGRQGFRTPDLLNVKISSLWKFGDVSVPLVYPKTLEPQRFQGISAGSQRFPIGTFGGAFVAEIVAGFGPSFWQDRFPK